MDRQKIERSIKGLSEWQMHVQAESDIDTNISTAIEALKAQLSQEGTTKDAISRQAALEKVRAMQTYKLFEGDDMILVDKAEVQTELMMLPTAQPEPQWVPLNSGKFPEESGTYTVTAYDGVTTRVTYAKYQKRLKRWELTGARAYWRVIAWMPLPEPYQKGATT